ncbi:MAG: hypothetical protein NZ744_01015, partial [Pirellulaceae bacterium]|nr:hypothetical protein [Pirellulaceae bacterium]
NTHNLRLFQVIRQTTFVLGINYSSKSSYSPPLISQKGQLRSFSQLPFFFALSSSLACILGKAENAQDLRYYF